MSKLESKNSVKSTNISSIDDVDIASYGAHTISNKIHILLDESDKQEAKNDYKNALDTLNEAWLLHQTDTKATDNIKPLLIQKLSHLYLKRQEYKKLEELSILLLDISRKTGDKEKEVTALTNLAIGHSVTSDYMSAMPLFVEALEKSQQLGLRYETANALINIGTIYANVFNYDEALDRYQRVLSEYEDVLTEDTHIAIYLNTGNLYYASEEYPIALKYLKKAFQLAQAKKDKQWIAQISAQMSRTYLALGKIDDAILKAQIAADMMASMVGNVRGRQTNLINLGQIEFINGNTEGGISFTMKGIAAARRVNDDRSELRGFDLLAALYKKNKDFEKALKCQSLYSRKQAAYMKMQRNMHALDLEIRFALKEKQQKIEELTKENRYQALLLERNSQIEKQNEQLRQANVELQQFAYITSHDLKEPLRMIGSFSQIIQRQYAAKLEGSADSYFQYINEGVTRMHGLLDALLQYATIGKLDLDLEVVDVADVLRITKTNLKVAIEESNANILCGEMPTVKAVSSLLVQLFQNLINNAIKFRGEDSRPIVLVNADSKANEWLFSVEDNGIGIADEHKERIFIIFQRLHTRTKYSGTGIGLAICHKIVTQFGGRIWVESEAGKGSTFFFTIPK
jgi:signal transduction histidine kinase